MDKIFIDTGGWVGLFNKKDKYHVEAKNIYQKMKFDKPRIYTSDYVLDETLTLIKYRGGFQDAINAGRAILESKLVDIVNIDSHFFHKAWSNFEKYKDQDFSFTDAATIAVMRELNISKIFAFDGALIKAGFVKYQ